MVLVGRFYVRIVRGTRALQLLVIHGTCCHVVVDAPNSASILLVIKPGKILGEEEDGYGNDGALLMSIICTAVWAKGKKRKLH